MAFVVPRVNSEALELIRSLQSQLRKTSEEAKKQKQKALRAEVLLQAEVERVAQEAVLQQEAQLALQKALSDRDEAYLKTEEIASELKRSQSELFLSEQKEEDLVETRLHLALEAECHTLQKDLESSKEKKALLEKSLEEAQRAKLRRDEQIRSKLDEKLIELEAKEAKKIENKRRGNLISSRAVAEEQLRGMQKQKASLEALQKQKELCEKDLSEILKDSSSLEERLSELRERNRVLELQIEREQTDFESKRKEIRGELRKQSLAFRTFASLLEEPWIDSEP